ncbi:MAG: helix-turn-helix domain-containing protein [Clostridiales bacterium]|nr:helix-turn-helix domain-containing protein [Clostridiales bacterium]
MDAATVGATIRALRQEQNLTQKELAQRLHVTDKAVSKWERGLNFPDLTLLEPLAQALDTTVPHLLGLEQENTQEAVSALSDLAAQEQEQVRREIRNRNWFNVFCCVILWAAAIWSSFIMSNHGLYGLPQFLTAGMSGWYGTMIGSNLYAIRKSRSLKPRE